MSDSSPPGREAELERTAMSDREYRRAEVLARVLKDDLSIVDAATLLVVSYRQGPRLLNRMRGGVRQEGACSRESREAFESIPPEERAGASARDRGEALWRPGRGSRAAFRPDAVRGTPVQRSRHSGGCTDAQTLDAQGQALVSSAEDEEAVSQARPERAPGRICSARRQFSRLVGGSGSGGVPAHHDRRCHWGDAGQVQQRGDDLGCSASTTVLDREVRGAEGVVRGCEKCVRARRDGQRAGGRDQTCYPLRSHVREAWHRSDRGQNAAGQGTDREESRDKPGPAGQEDAAQGHIGLRVGQSISRVRVLPTARYPLCCCSAEAGGLSHPVKSAARSQAGFLS